MTWTYKSYSDGHSSLLTDMENGLNDITNGHSDAVILVAMSEVKSDDAHGVIFYNPVLTSQEHFGTPTWSNHNCGSSKGDYDQIYKDMCSFLNDNNISEQSQYWSQLAFTDDPDQAYLTLFYPS